jgi:hypothetical protein
MLRVSTKLKLAVLRARVAGTRQYEIASRVIIDGKPLHQSVFSSLINDIRPVRPNDPRIVGIGQALGLAPADCFEGVDDRRR